MNEISKLPPHRNVRARQYCFRKYAVLVLRQTNVSWTVQDLTRIFLTLLSRLPYLIHQGLVVNLLKMRLVVG